MSKSDLLYATLSSDALAIVRQAEKQTNMTLVVTAKPADAHRLADEISWFMPQLRVCVFPDWETLPYERFSPHQSLISERLSALYAMAKKECDIAIVAVTTAMHRLPPLSYLMGHLFFFEAGDTLSIDLLRSQLVEAGYNSVNQVIAPGEYAIRGGLVDLFPMGAKLPFRIDLFDDEIESIKTFDVDTQRTIETMEKIRLLPAREFPTDEDARATFRANFRETFEGDPSKSQLYREVTAGLFPAGIEYYLPLFFDKTASIFDYIDPASQMILHGNLAEEMAAWWSEVTGRYQLLGSDTAFPLLAPWQVFLPEEQFFGAIKPFSRQNIRLVTEGLAEEAPITPLYQALPTVAICREAADPLSALRQFTEAFGGKILISVDSAGRQETMIHLLTHHQLKPEPCIQFADCLQATDKLMITVSPLHAGFIAGDYAIITETELYPSTARLKSRRKSAKDNRLDHWIRDLVELSTGEMVVHQQYGIGCYEGLVTKNFGEGDTEFLMLQFADADKLYVPVSQLQVISRYHGSETVEPSRLGSAQWEKARQRAAEQARDTAAELLLHYAQRAARTGHRFSLDEDDYERFCDQFGFEETEDQQQTIDAVLNDMLSEKPMDRLVCGDVGFGKTEVALRAAFVAASNGTQVAVLAPTTLLVEQHYQNFSSRFASFPIRVVNLSRFRSAKEIEKTLGELEAGQVDIVIGTHRLLQDDVRFKQLGLLVIDEEHRFGVRQKESLKMLRAEVDTLRLTATPIPRSLAMSIEGLSDFSVITTAPQKRLSIRTMVSEYSHGIIREACLREIKRGGQVYFLHNKVSTINAMHETLQKIMPEAQIEVGHGKMHERDLERVMRDFVQQRFNILLCTTIIETGIDIPNANTIIIDRADKFGLAQLHQLRGRVGRSHHQAYAYLLTPEGVKLSAIAEKRLDAIRSMQDLGSGFYLAMHDLEIRGAGEVLGDAQSGEIQEVGFELFQKMLNKAVDALKKGEQPDLMSPLMISAEVNLHFPALLPDAYCPDVHERLTLYKRLSDCEDLTELILLKEELIDRFGQLPAQAECLVETHRIRLLCATLGVEKVDASEEKILLQFSDNPTVDTYRIIQLIQNNRAYNMAGQDKLVVSKKTVTLDERVQAISAVFIALTASTEAEKAMGDALEKCRLPMVTEETMNALTQKSKKKRKK